WINTPTEGYDIVELPYLPNFPSGGFAVTGRGLFYMWDAFMMCVDQIGNVVHPYCKSLMGTNDDEGYSIILDGTDLVIAGWTNSYAPQPPQGPNKANIFVWKTSLINNFDIFGKVYGWADDDEKLMDEQGLIRTIDGNYAVAGWTCSQGPGGGAAPTPNFLIMKVSATNGDVIWSRVHPSIPGANFEEAYPIIQTINSGYAIAGWTNSFGIAQSEDFHFLTLDQNGERPVCVLSLMPDTFWFGTEPDSGVLFTEGFNTTQIPLKDTSVMYTDVCVITQQGDATPTDAVPDTIEVCHSTWFKVTIANVGTGTLAAGWWVHLQIEQEQYFDSLYVSVPIPPQTTYLDSFYVHFNHNCLHRVKIITAYPNDPNNQNDTLNKSVIGRYTDPFEITHLSISPSGPWYVNDYVVFDVKVHNNNKHVSDSMLTTWVYLDIVKPDLSVIRDSQQVVNLAPCDTTTLWFPTQGEFQFDTAGSWYIDAFPAFIPGDSHPDNNFADSTITVTIGPVTGPWVQVESMPPLIGVVKWHIKDGGAIVGVPGDKQEISALYAFRGTRTPDFKKYTVGSGWANVETIPFGYKYKPGYPIDSTKFNKKYPTKGAALCYDGYNTIYAVKGNGLWEFWAYDIANDTWVLKPWIPSFKGPKAGSGLAYYDGYVYLLVGSIKLEENYFFRYSVAGDSWEVLPKPTGVTKPWKAGSALAAYNGKIYAMKAGEKPNWFLNFDPSTLEWGTPETLTTFDSVAGGIKKLYVKAGGCMATADDGIYGIKGGGTNTFYKYTTTDGWVQLVSDTIPRLHQKSVPKEGAAMGYVDGKIYLLKGNKTPEFWCYTPYPKENVKPTVAVMNIPSTMAKNLTATYEFSFEVMPNPFKKLTTIHYTVPIADNVSIKLYNVSGRLIKTLVNKHLNAGSYTTTLTNIARGVYFLKYQDNTNTKEVKLIVQ
ncbi:MAG: T9SS type A sorting domain-containing protein, partial [candidate division WOR-3 bacterium]